MTTTALPAIESAFKVLQDEDAASELLKEKQTQTIKKKKDPFAYRHYVTFHPAQNKILDKRWDQRTRELHLKRLKEAKPSIDNSPPKVYPHLELRLKRLKLEEERLSDIRRKNLILLDRIAFQMLHSSVDKGGDNYRRLNRGRAIHSEERRRKNAIIHSENMIIFQRIENKAPNYNRHEWISDRQRNLGYLKNISQFPANYYKLLEELPAAPQKPKPKQSLKVEKLQEKVSKQLSKQPKDQVKKVE